MICCMKFCYGTSIQNTHRWNQRNKTEKMEDRCWKKIYIHTKHSHKAQHRTHSLVGWLSMVSLCLLLSKFLSTKQKKNQQQQHHSSLTQHSTAQQQHSNRESTWQNNNNTYTHTHTPHTNHNSKWRRKRKKNHKIYSRFITIYKLVAEAVCQPTRTTFVLLKLFSVPLFLHTIGTFSFLIFIHCYMVVLSSVDDEMFQKCFQ